MGIEIAIDKDKAKKIEVSGPGVPAGATQPDFEETYANDVPTMKAWGLKVISVNKKFDVGIVFIKWYRVTVSFNKISPIVSLFLDKDGTLSDWEKSYPQTDQFKINMSADSLTKFWKILEENKTITTQKEREHLIKLLKKGGRVCLPQTNSFDTIFVNEDGKFVASASLKK